MKCKYYYHLIQLYLKLLHLLDSSLISNLKIQNYKYLDENGNSHQIDHILIRNNGIFCIETKNYSGTIYGKENSKNWIQYINSSKNYFYNPLLQNKSHIACINKILNYKYKIISLVVFIQNNADNIRINNVINLNKLLNYVTTYNNFTSYTDEEIQNIMNTLIINMSNISNREHVENIESNKNLIEHNICPRCKMGMLILKPGKYGPFYGCTNYPKCTFVMSIDSK